MRKQTNIRFNVHGTHRLSLALCTVLALSVASLQADDKDKGKDQGGPGAASKSETGKSGQLSKGDERFVREAARSGMMEVQMGRLGVQKAQNAELKQFAQRLIDDHTRANQELRQIAARKNVTLPEADGIAGTPDADRTPVREREDADGKDADKTHKGKEHAAMKKLEGLSGTEFDREFVRAAASHHQKDVKEFEKAARELDDTELKAFAQKTLPTLREHLQQVQGLQGRIGNGQGAPGNDGSGADAGTSSAPGNRSSGTGTPE